MALLTKGVDLYRELRGRNDQLRAEGIAIGKEMGLEQGLEQGREQGQAEIRDRLRELGLDLDELLRSDDDDDTESDDDDEESATGETDNP